MSTTTSRSGRRQPAKTSSRLPSTRERRPALAALGVLLIVGGALASAWLALRVSDRADYLVVTVDLAQTQEITPGDLGTVSLPNDVAGAIPEDEREGVIGQFAAAPLVGGTILHDGLLSTDSGAPDGKAVAAHGFESDNVPENIVNGSPILLSLPPVDDGTEPDGVVPATVSRIIPPSADEEGFSGGTSDLTTINFYVPKRCFDVVSIASFDQDLGLGFGTLGEGDGLTPAPCMAPPAEPAPPSDGGGR